MPIFDPAKCDGCGLCILVCKCEALILESNTVNFISEKAEDCGWCMDCELVCPTGALQCPFEIVLAEE
ncbi:MAG: 4Fe-4S binding protein [Dehalococcoidia bacterium]|nr:4Fe-4S binding protein [Dehalococcoidia bacterium]